MSVIPQAVKGLHVLSTDGHPNTPPSGSQEAFESNSHEHRRLSIVRHPPSPLSSLVRPAHQCETSNDTAIMTSSPNTPDAFSIMTTYVAP